MLVVVTIPTVGRIQSLERVLVLVVVTSGSAGSWPAITDSTRAASYPKPKSHLSRLSKGCARL